ncbi:hypothetical protein MNBD_GAMMA12-3327 [hydrothermal vent metagenome]|uniref:Pyrrolo-quinoline quinone repeat domain-containing protein n=1 Tax=hydrothermal vent metagenome TaxID=652676 RepID=A0A3B0Y940_9ZZZZ
MNQHQLHLPRIYYFFIGIYLIINTLLVSASGETNKHHPHNPCYANKYLYTGGSGLQKFNPSTNKYVWSVLKQLNTFEPVCTKKHIYIGSRSGLFAIESTSGKVLWSIGSKNGSKKSWYSPVVVGRFLYVTSLDGWIKKLHKKSGKLVWEKKLSGWLYPPAVFDKIVITGGKARTLYALSTTYGKILWRRPLQQELVYRPIAANSDTLIITSYQSKLIAINVHNNSILWTKTHTSAPYTATVVDKNIIYGDQNGVMYAVNFKSGKEIWRTPLSGIIRSIPALSKSTIHSTLVWIGTEAGHIAALNKNNGAIVWEKNTKQPIVHTLYPLNKKIYFKVDSKKLMFELFSFPKTILKTAVSNK